MNYIRIDGQDYPITDYKEAYSIEDEADSLYITLSMTYEEILGLFKDNMAWKLVKTLTENKLFSNFKHPVNDLSEYCRVMTITDNRDDTFTVKVNKLSKIEKAVKEALQTQAISFISEIEADEAYTRGVNES